MKEMPPILSDNPYRTNEFCVNWQDNLIATSMGDAYELGKKLQRLADLRWFVEWLEERFWFEDCLNSGMKVTGYRFSIDFEELKDKLVELEL